MLERLKSKRLYSVVFLTIVVLISVSMLLVINSFTSVVVEAENDAKIRNILESIFPDLTKFEESGEIFIVYEGDNIAGYTFIAVGNGYGGTINLLIGMNPDYTLRDMEVLSHTETPGLGSKITEEPFIEQFIGLSVDDIALSKDGGKIDAITGATISSRAVASAIQERMIEIIEMLSSES
jgi:Na+-translocating ferredoxin:NAD+ oxidoreductase subunit G